MEDAKIFKSYSRKLVRDLKDLQEAVINNDVAKAKQLFNDLIEDTQKSIED